jgi:DNA repair ATPase RecN
MTHTINFEIFLYMQKQIKQPMWSGWILYALDDATDSINRAITHFQDSETQRILRKYGFDINEIIQDLNESKQDVTLLKNSYQRCNDIAKKISTLQKEQK